MAFFFPLYLSQNRTIFKILFYCTFPIYLGLKTKVKECDGTHSECCARRVPHSEEIARHIERRDPCGHAAVWLQGSTVQGRYDRPIVWVLVKVLSVKIIFSHVVLGTPVLITKEKPRKNQGTTKELRKNSQPQKSTFIKIAASFPPFIPSLIPPTDNREMTDRTPHQLPAHKKCCFLRLAS